MAPVSESKALTDVNCLFKPCDEDARFKLVPMLQSFWIHDCSDIALFHYLFVFVALLAKAKAVDLLTLP